MAVCRGGLNGEYRKYKRNQSIPNQEMAWLDSNGLIYALVTLFSLRRVFLIAAAYLVVINLLIGCARGMLKEEKARRKRAEAPLPVKEPVENNDVFGGIIK